MVRAGRPGAGQRQGRRGEREDRADLRHHDQTACGVRSGDRQDGLGRGAGRRVRSAVRLTRRVDPVRALVRGTALERGGHENRRDDQEDRPELTRAQHALLARRRRGLPCRPGIDDAVDCGSEDPHGVERRRSVCCCHQAVHGQWRADDRLRQRQRAARLRSRRHPDRQEAASGGGARLPAGARSIDTAAPATASA